MEKTDINGKLKILPPDGYYNDEIREGYTVQKKQKQIWAIEIDLFCELKRVCDKYNLRMLSFAGTMLGAIRHKGFIPWDDDMDVCFLPEDFYKLLEVADKEFKHPYFLQHALNDREFFCGYARLRNSETTGVIAWNDSPNYNNGIYIDVFIINGIPQNKIQELSFKIRFKLVNQLIKLYSNTLPSNYIKRVIKVIAKSTVCKVLPYETAVEYYRRTIGRYDRNSDQYGLMTHGLKNAKKYSCRLHDFENINQFNFEYITVPVSNNYDEMLKSTYGEYMKFPPVEQRGKWHEGKIHFDPEIPYKEYFYNKEYFYDKDNV